MPPISGLHSLNHGDKEIIIFFIFLHTTLFARKIARSYVNHSKCDSLSFLMAVLKNH